MKTRILTNRDKIFMALLAIGLLCCVLILTIPSARILVIELVEKFFFQRSLNHDYWLNILFLRSIGGIVTAGILIFVVLFTDYKKHLLKCTGIIKEAYLAKSYRQFFMPVLCMFGLYALAISSIIRANFLYIDDMGRAVSGYRQWSDWSRYISDFLAIFIHADTHINDASPLPQLTAAFFIACSSVLLVYVVCGKKLPKTALLASMPLGLSPYFLECFSYKFDAPYMALSILASVIPFLFMESYAAFIFYSIISLLIMSMTYQAASGIYILIVIVLCFKDWNCRQKKPSEILRFLAVSALTYAFAMFLFRFLLMKPVDFYASTSIYPVSQIFLGVLNNTKIYFSEINGDFGPIWKVLLMLAAACFAVKTMITTKRNPVIAVFSALALVIIMAVLSFGAYLILQKPLTAPRAMYGFGIFIALLGIYPANSSPRAAAIPALALSWCFFVFSFSYGNALADQKRYSNFRTEILLKDLSTLFPDKTDEEIFIQLRNNINYAPSIDNIASRNPVIRRLVPGGLGSGWVWGYTNLVHYYRFKSVGSDRLIDTAEDERLEVALDTYYHTIKTDGGRVLVILK